MSVISSRDKILQKLNQVSSRRNLTANLVDYANDEIYHAVGDDLLKVFKNEAEAVSAQVIECTDDADLWSQITQWMQLRGIKSIYSRVTEYLLKMEELNIPHTSNGKIFSDIEVGLTGCECLIARTGTVLVSSASESGRQLHVFPPIHLVIADKNQLVEFVSDGIALISEKYAGNLPSQIVHITGPSRTADIEKTLVMGAHGPKELIIFVKS